MNDAEIVLVEDNDDDLAVALRALERSEEGYRVRSLRDGEEAMRWVRRLEEGSERPPKVVFLDLRLPRVDGQVVLAALRRAKCARSLPVVVVSSTQSESEIEECYRLGANSFIAKKYGERAPGQYIVEAARYWLGLNTAAR